MAYNTAAIRELLKVAFDDQELTDICFDHFRPVYQKFALETGHLVKIQLLIGYCDRQGEFDKLLALVESINPTQYSKFIHIIKEASHIPKMSSSSGRRSVEIVLRGDLPYFTPEIQLATVRALAGILDIPHSQINVVQVRSGSIILRIEIPNEAADQLIALYEANDPIIWDLGIQGVRVITSSIPEKSQGARRDILNNHLARIGLFAFNVGPTWVRRFIVNNLARRDRTVAKTIIPLAIHDENLGVRLATLAVVGHYRRLKDLDVLAIALRDPHEVVRATAASILGESRLRRVGSYLQSALKDPSPAVRAAVALALGLIRIEEFSPALERALGDEDLQVRRNAAWALGRLGHAEALIPLQVMAARDPIYKNRELAQQAGLKIRRRIAPEAEKRRLLRTELTGYLLDQSRSSAERRRVKNALIHLGGEALIPLLDQALEKINDPKIHLDIVEILVTLTPGKQLQNVLIRCLHQISPPVRHLAITALGDIGDREAIYYLGKVAHEGQQPNQLLNLEDTRLALEAIEKIDQRTKKELPQTAVDSVSNPSHSDAGLE